MIVFRTRIIRDAAGEIIDTIELPPRQREAGADWRDAEAGQEIVESEERPQQ